MTEDQARELIGQRRKWKGGIAKCVRVAVLTSKSYGESADADESDEWADLYVEVVDGVETVLTPAEWERLTLFGAAGLESESK